MSYIRPGFYFLTSTEQLPALRRIASLPTVRSVRVRWTKRPVLSSREVVNTQHFLCLFLKNGTRQANDSMQLFYQTVKTHFQEIVSKIEQNPQNDCLLCTDFSGLIGKYNCLLSHLPDKRRVMCYSVPLTSLPWGPICFVGRQSADTWQLCAELGLPVCFQLPRMLESLNRRSLCWWQWPVPWGQDQVCSEWGQFCLAQHLIMNWVAGLFLKQLSAQGDCSCSVAARFLFPRPALPL